MQNPIVIGAILRVENIEECLADWERHIFLRAYSGTQFEMTIDEQLGVETRFRVGDYWTTVSIPQVEYGFGLLEMPPEANAELRRKDAAMRDVHARNEAGWKQEEAEEVMEHLQHSAPEMTHGHGAENAPARLLFAPGIICTFTQGPFHPLRLEERAERGGNWWVVCCLDHNERGLVNEDHMRHATPEETANLQRKGGGA